VHDVTGNNVKCVSHGLALGSQDHHRFWPTQVKVRRLFWLQVLSTFLHVVSTVGGSRLDSADVSSFSTPYLLQ
jgi:hypothetical protein